MKNNLTLLFTFLCIVYSAHRSAAQCGVTAVVTIQQTGSSRGQLEGFNSVPMPGCSIIGYQWAVNNAVADNDSVIVFHESIPMGLNIVELTVTATDSATGDTCTDTYSNIYMSTGDGIYTVIRVTDVGGLSKMIDGYWYGGDPAGVGPFTIDPGDSTGLLSGPNVFHTYANPGSYKAEFQQGYNANDYSGRDWVARKIHVNDGYDNIDGLQNNFIQQYCDSFKIMVNSNPPYTSGYLFEVLNIDFNGAGSYNLQQGVPVGGRFLVPGENMLAAYVTDSSPNNVISCYYPIFVNDNCMTLPDTVSGFAWDDADADGIKDSAEAMIANQEITVFNYNGYTDSSGNYRLPIPHVKSRFNVTGISNNNVTVPGPSGYQVTFNTSGNHPNYNFGITQSMATITGRIYVDLNNNGTFSAGADYPLRGVTVKAYNAILGLEYITSTDNTGVFGFNIPIGTYTVTPIQPLIDDVVMTPNTFIASAVNVGGTYGQDIRCTSTSPDGNLGLRLTSSNQARPGFDYHVNCRIINTGIDTCKGTVTLTLDSALIINSINPLTGIIDTANHTVTWTTSNLIVTATAYFSANTTIPASTSLGTVLHNSATVSILPGYIDQDLSNNSGALNQTVMGSFDPNDKLVFPEGSGPGGDVLHGTRLQYRINFQNTGTASAINVSVQDHIDDDLDLNTFQMIRASHAYQLNSSGRDLTWRFLNINLPDSNTSETGSHGFIEYSIEPKQGLVDGTTAYNHADIYFDFNAPVVTNTVVNTFQTVIVNISEEVSNDEATVAPNPAHETLYIYMKNAGAGVKVTLTSSDGKSVSPDYIYSSAQSKIKLDVRNLAAGLYIASIETSSGRKTVHFIKE